MTEKEIAIGSQIFAKRVDYFYFRLPLKINEHIAAENQVKRAAYGIRLVSEIEPPEVDYFSKFVHGFYFAFFGAEAFEKEPALIFEGNARDSLHGQIPAEARARTLVERSVPRTSTFHPAEAGKCVKSVIASE